MTDKNEVLELAKKCGARTEYAPAGGYPFVPYGAITFNSSTELLAFDAAREEKHRAQIARMVDRFTKIIAEPQETLSDAKAMREMLRIAKAAISENQQSSEAFLAEVRAKARLEFSNELSAMTTEEMMKSLYNIRNPAAQPEGKQG